ncbi:S1C family serine protease [Virgibacillus alimentarius]|uniref:Serine protease Do n=1 Tax=Virgibacillus alimentarius TaxID=698769 RepID=A0ABS4SAZ3_9BACI|nr:trypsin-like peptidase domain-containing protein [Virgibacillus alimentarius]MBP2258286.1 serine protease Do [Virgibacillus alimentarius]
MDHNDNNQTEQNYSDINNQNLQSEGKSPLSPVSKKQKGAWKNTLFGGIVGGIISAVIVVLLFSTNISSPISSNKDTNTPETSSHSDKETAEVTKTLSSEDANVSSNLEQVSDAVVGVINLQRQDIWTPNQEAGTGSGIIYKKENGKAYIVTNHHVVENAKEVEVALNDDERIKAKVLGSDELTDLAVLQIDGEKIDTVAKLGTSKDLKAGETVVAIGNPLGMEFANSLTKGIISGLNRSVRLDTNGDRQPDWITEVIQTDAAINPGNSGGALVNEDGEVIGINSMKIAKQTVEGIGFSIPIDSALSIMEQLESKGKVARPVIGISTASLNQVPPQYRSEIQLPEDIEGGMVVADVQTDSPAEEAGLKQFDIITKINDHAVTSILELRKYMYSQTEIGDTVKLEFYRDGEPQTANLNLAKREE